MSLRKIKNDNSVKYIHSANTPPIESSNETKLNTEKKIASNNTFPQKNKKANENITAEGFRIIKLTKNCYF